ncbi:heme peroxidase [Roridomyces roridus]|uniref:Peroxidase n=1 Tax=Roridomyces roridus TaxID=1738132 RepID=A0AAD7BAS0_9AGAR|nr:heme peroxidase [Roridomyces roridus]
MFPLLTLSLSLATLTHAYIWPSPQLDALEAARFDQLGLDGEQLAGRLNPCDSFVFALDGSGRTNAADWIRTAWSDVATYDASAGTGGLDASIRFGEEQQRPENAGTSASDTFAVVTPTRYIGYADTLALMTTMAIENCGGPVIPFRGGRVDATEANAPGVPQPQQDLSSHTAAFARAGFSQTDMIGLVACGHTFGGVQHSVYPNIVNVLNEPNDADDVADFDSTFVTFDNNVASEYISGTTKNPLVVGFNDTTNSDKRIFGSDGNVTMKSFAQSPSLFASTCSSLFARMLDTVPSGVELTDVITPLPIKPAFVEFSLNNKSLEMAGQVRFWNQTQSQVGTVIMLWDDHLGGTGIETLKFFGTGTYKAGQVSSAWYGFNTSSPNTNKILNLDPVAGVERLRFLVNDQVQDQGGVGFAVQDAYMFSDTSCITLNEPQIGLVVGRLDVAVRTSANLTRLYIETSGSDAFGRVTVTETDITRPAQPVVPNPAYELWSLTVNSTFGFTIGAVVDGEKFSTTLGRSVNTNQWPACPGVLI